MTQKVALKELTEFIVRVCTVAPADDSCTISSAPGDEDALLYFQGWVDQALLEVTYLIHKEDGQGAVDFVKVLCSHLGIDPASGQAVRAEAQAALEELDGQPEQPSHGGHDVGGTDGARKGGKRDGERNVRQHGAGTHGGEDKSGEIRKALVLESLEAIDAAHATNTVVLQEQQQQQQQQEEPQQQPKVASFIRSYATEQQKEAEARSSTVINITASTSYSFADDSDIYIRPADLPAGVQEPFSAKLAKVIMFTARRTVASVGLELKLKRLNKEEFQFLELNHPLHRYYLFMKELEREKMLSGAGQMAVKNSNAANKRDRNGPRVGLSGQFVPPTTSSTSTRKAVNDVNSNVSTRSPSTSTSTAGRGSTSNVGGDGGGGGGQKVANAGGGGGSGGQKVANVGGGASHATSKKPQRQKGVSSSLAAIARTAAGAGTQRQPPPPQAVGRSLSWNTDRKKSSGGGNVDLGDGSLESMLATLNLAPP